MTTVEILKEMAFTATETQRKALEDAISVLSNKGNLIDRQKVLATLDNADKFLDEERTVEKYKELLTECIKVLPSAENKGESEITIENINLQPEKVQEMFADPRIPRISFGEKARVTQLEGQYLDTGITQGIV